MKFKKSFIGIFLLSFFIGCGIVFLLVAEKPTIEKPLLSEPKEIDILSVDEAPLPTQIESKFTPEIFGLEDFSDDSVSPKYKIKLVDIAEHGANYRKSEVIAKNGETWLGLFSKNGESYLKNTKVKINFDSDMDKNGGAEIIFKETQPLFLLKNAKKIKEGKVVTLFQENSSEIPDWDNRTNIMYRGFVREFQLGERTYTFSIKDAMTKSGETVLALVLETENVNQIITYGAYFDNDYLGSLLWVGDLDNDSKLDFYIDYNNYEKGSFRSNLFLSSEAEKGKLVKKVAGFSTAGC